MHALLHWVRDLYARQLRDKLGNVSDERIKWEVALRQYGSNRTTRELIERTRARMARFPFLTGYTFDN
jgi:hypothetical protein